MADNAGPAVVHCSSGIGRTGVLVACDIGMQGLLQGEPRVDVLRIVSTLRQDRAGMIQTREQYRFIHEVLCMLLCVVYTLYCFTSFSGSLQCCKGRVLKVKKEATMYCMNIYFIIHSYILASLLVV